MKRLAFVLLVILATFNSQAVAEPKPNLIIFLSDDHSVLDSSVYGAKDIRTPNMERLAKDGLTFDRAFIASPACAPSRAAMLTGLMPARNGAEANHSKPKAEIKKLPAYLQELGYEVAAIGKVSHYKHTGDFGFNYFAHDGFHEDIAIPEALKWLEKRMSDKPLCLFVGSNWPHVPWPNADEAKDLSAIEIPESQVETPLTRQVRARYYAAISRMDAELGQVYDLTRKKFGTNAFFLHSSDHGAQWPFGKWNLYDAGIRTPMMVVWPGKTQAGTRTDALVSWVDILPTLVELAGGNVSQKIDGRSFKNVLLGKTKVHREMIFTTHSGDGNHNVYPSRSVRDDRWRYILNLHPEFKFTSHVTEAANDIAYWKSWVEKAKTNRDAARKVRRYQQRPAEELYDLEKDPLEQKNLAKDSTHADRLAKMRGAVRDWMKEQGDKETVFGSPKYLSRSFTERSAK